MSIVDADRLESGSVVTADVCIVGAGAAGITLVRALDGASETVCLLESGGYDVDEDTQSLCDVEVAGHPMHERFMARARCFGGTCNLWAGRSMKLTAVDLEARDWVPDSGWPISYAELDRYYTKAAGILRLPVLDPSRDALLQRRMSPLEKALFLNDELEPTVSLWARTPLRFGAAYGAALRTSRNVRAHLRANATEIVLNAAGDSVEALTVATLRGTRLRVRARRFVLACGGLENARLLLVSRGVHGGGIANQHDVVGRFFMNHPRAVWGTVRLCGAQRLPLLLGVPLRDGIGQVGIQLSAAVQRREGLLNNYLTLERKWSPRAAKAYAGFVRLAFSDAKLAAIPETIYLLAPRALVPHSMYRVLRAVRNALGSPRELGIINYCEQPPHRESRVRLSEQRDRLGMRRLVVDWRIGTQETRTLMRLHALLDLHLRTHGIGQVVADAHHEVRYSDASHHMGTTRMSESPRTGVVDGDCKVHGVQNLFIAGSSVFPTCGHANPTWTIVALALRLADHLKASR